MKTLVCWIGLAGAAWAQGCLQYDQPVALEGKLVEVDMAGYERYAVLELARPICMQAAGKGGSGEARASVARLQVFPEGKDAASQQYKRLTGYRVRVEGRVVLGATGYYRIGIAIFATGTVPLDAEGTEALRQPEPAASVKDVARYEVLVDSGERLTLTARDLRSREALSPADLYAPHWMTGARVVYIKCAGGYRMQGAEVTPRGATSCTVDEEGCAVTQGMRVHIRFACVRER